MSRKRTSALAQTRAQRRALRLLAEQCKEAAQRHTREAIEEGLLDGRIEGDEVILLDGTPATSRRTRPT